ncbi:ROK family protein [Palleronia sp. LCG004]|uniref:ROK family transcriptional regulator n=1 Tax=Palleronia sp. LCG004 TaxID=3079304 RepID=UPI0029421903|nr:ROK family protein [Palleronia sp. LCG004]WOI57585.1 ROK family protein [Palleronia sp. LCG004]
MPQAVAGRVGCGPLLRARAGTGDATAPLRQQIFESVRAEGTISRAEIARTLGVSPGSVTSAATELLSAGYLEETHAPPRDSEGTGRGRPPVALAVRPGAGLVAGIKLSETANSAVLHDFAGGPVAQISEPGTGRAVPPAALARIVARLVDAALAQAGRERHELDALGIGMPGFVDSAAGNVHWSTLIDRRNVPLRDVLERKLGLPVTVDNDANLLTLAELWFGDGREVSTFAVVTIEHGVGMGIVLDNRVFRGARGLGTELGHIKVQLDGALCRCGQRGCLEAYVADYALVREASTALDWSMTDGLDASTILARLHEEAKAGNAAARSIFRRAGRFLAVGLANVVNLFDPELIILSGERMEYDFLYADEVLAEMIHAAIHVDRPPPRVEIHAWGDLIWARGAAALALGQLTSLRLGSAGGLETV